jgi:hypothetical protein
MLDLGHIVCVRPPTEPAGNFPEISRDISHETPPLGLEVMVPLDDRMVAFVRQAGRRVKHQELLDGVRGRTQKKIEARKRPLAAGRLDVDTSTTPHTYGVVEPTLDGEPRA